MDKLNKNMFGLGVILVIAALGGGAWKLVLEPSADLKEVAGVLAALVADRQQGRASPEQGGGLQPAPE